MSSPPTGVSGDPAQEPAADLLAVPVDVISRAGLAGVATASDRVGDIGRGGGVDKVVQTLSELSERWMWCDPHRCVGTAIGTPKQNARFTCVAGAEYTCDLSA